MKSLTITLIALILASCASNELSEQEMALVQAQMEQQTLTVECPAGCTVSYRDPRDQVTIPRNTNGWDALIAVQNSIERTLNSAFPIVGMGYLGVEAVKALGETGNSSTVTTTNTDRSVGDYSGESSGNAGQQYTDTSGRINSDDDYTHEPNVVNQPEPVIVDQPEPIIVEPASE